MEQSVDVGDALLRLVPSGCHPEIDAHCCFGEWRRQRICRRVVILEQGCVLADGTLYELRERFPAQLKVKVEAPPDWARRLSGARVSSADQDGVLLVVDPGADVQAIVRAAQAAGPIEHFAFESAGLLDLYRQMVSE